MKQPTTNKMQVQHKNVIIETEIPIARILKLEMNHELSEHGILSVRVVIKPEKQSEFIRGHYLRQNIKFFSDDDPNSSLIFSGQIKTITYQKQDEVITATIEAISYSFKLDEREQHRTFQNPNMSFKELLDEVTKDIKARYNWQAGADKELGKPFVQYNETDWELIKRLASYFNQPIHASLLSEQADIYIGIRKGIRQEINEATITKLGVDERYYKTNGNPNNLPKEHYYYIKVRNREAWQLGDYASYQNKRLTVINTQARFENGELTFTHTLGMQGYLWQNTIYSKHLVGLHLQGTVKETKKESIKIQLDIDQTDQASYLWSWTPEIGNFGYIMPEIDARICLTFPTNDEVDATAIHLLRENPNSEKYQKIENKQIETAEDKLLGLYPDQLLLAGKNQNVKVTLEDQEGISLESHKKINIKASEEIHLKGKSVNIFAPNQVLMQTTASNIDIATNFNFFAPQGVVTGSERDYQADAKNQSMKGGSHKYAPLKNGAKGAMPKSANANIANQNVMSNMASGSLPMMATGRTVNAINNASNGNPISKTQKSFQVTNSLSMKGGSQVPQAKMSE